MGSCEIVDLHTSDSYVVVRPWLCLHSLVGQALPPIFRVFAGAHVAVGLHLLRVNRGFDTSGGKETLARLDHCGRK